MKDDFKIKEFPSYVISSDIKIPKGTHILDSSLDNDGELFIFEYNNGLFRKSMLSKIDDKKTTNILRCSNDKILMTNILKDHKRLNKRIEHSVIDEYSGKL